ncbi:hypothetical protein SDC9_13748 [bioreactor metagenome]|uniref:Uncharacterized protein n=1 Tax=bioreactor metagenome TaxID=1076179 RepID=A0A644TM39_9ZZZZ|nr:hypothetical protein [Negativicutes bacterium]
MEKNKVYHYWNGKNSNGDDHVGNKFLIEEGSRNSTTEMKYEVGCETIAADDLQQGVDYE